MPNLMPSRLLRSTIALLAVTIAIGATQIFLPLKHPHLMQLLYGVVAVSAWYGGAMWGVDRDQREHQRTAAELQENIATLNQDLQHRVDELQALFDAIPAYLAIANDPQCDRIRVNAQFAELLNIDTSANAALPFLDEDTQPTFKVLINGEETSTERLPMRQAAANGVAIQDVEIDILRTDGAIFNLLGCAIPLFDEHKQPRGAVSVFLDISERKQVEAERTQLLAREQAARAEGEAAQQRFQAIFETSPVGIGYLDQEQRFIAINEALAEINGLSREAHLGHTVSELFGKTDPAIVQLFEQIYQTGEAFICPNFAVDTPGRSDRSPGFYNVSYLPSMKQDRVESVLVYVVDVTEQVRTKQQDQFLSNTSVVLASSLDYQTTLEQVAQLAVPELADWCTVDVLEEGGELRRLAVSHSDPAKVEWAYQIHRRYPPQYHDKHGLMHVLQTGQSEIYPSISDELLVETAIDPEHLEIMRNIGFSSVIIVPLVARGRTLGAISLVTAESGRHYDETDLAIAEELARRAAVAVDNARLYQQAQESNRLKDEFLATLSHELRSPLNGILGWAQLLQRGTLDETKVEKALKTIERNARAQVQLIDDLLDISRIIRGKLRLDVQPIELGVVIESAIDAIRPTAEAKSIQLSLDLDRAIGSVSGDQDRLQQIIWNLLSNAIKFTPSGGQVHIQLRQQADQAEIAISDTGKGISPEFLPYVFERFRQADSSITRVHGGLGLGLAIVRNLVELHGGSVQASSPGEGQGSTFTVRLPLVKMPQVVGTAWVNLLPATSPNEFRLDGTQVLIVDDEADTRELLSAILQEFGAVVTVASSAQEGFSLLNTQPPQILVSDIGMPGEDGYQLIQRVRTRCPSPVCDLPAIALTAYAREEDRERALLAGFQLHVAKPVDPVELVIAIASLLEPMP